MQRPSPCSKSASRTRRRHTKNIPPTLRGYTTGNRSGWIALGSRCLQVEIRLTSAFRAAGFVNFTACQAGLLRHFHVSGQRLPNALKEAACSSISRSLASPRKPRSFSFLQSAI